MSEKTERLEEIMDEMKDLLKEAQKLLPTGSITRSRAESYWIAHIATAIGNDHGYCGRSMCSMQDTLNEMEFEIAQSLLRLQEHNEENGEDEEEENEEIECSNCGSNAFTANWTCKTCGTREK